jgi:hypothetical protein
MVGVAQVLAWKILLTHCLIQTCYLGSITPGATKFTMLMLSLSLENNHKILKAKKAWLAIIVP